MTARALVRPARSLAALCLLVLGLFLGSTGPAQAHAVLIGSDPAQGAVVAETPERITFTFNETIGLVPDGVRVFDARGESIGSSASVTGSRMEVALTDPVEDGTLIVVWRVVSDDGHPVSGSLRFSVGAPSATVADIDAPDTGSGSPPLVLQLLRVAGYVGLLLTAGLIAFTVLVLPTGAPAPARMRLVRLARAASALAALAWLATVPVVATYQLGGGPGLLGRGSTWSALAPTEYLVPAVVTVGVIAAVVLLGPGSAAGPRRLLPIVAAGLAVIAPALTGHTRATSPEWLTIGVDMLHLVAGSVWLGGVVALVAVLTLLAEHKTAAAEALARFSTIAAGLLVALGLSGALLAWRIVGSWRALVETTYGRLLLVKVAIVLVVVLIAGWNRFVVLPQAQRAGSRRGRRAGAASVGRVVVAEAALLGIVLVVTGLLVDRSPDVQATEARPTVRSTWVGAIKAKVTVASPVTGPSPLTLELLDGGGSPTEGYDAPRASLSTEGLDLGAIALQNVGPGVYSGQVVFPSAGTWKLQISLRTGEFDNPVTTLDLTVKESPS